jgi:hypothetical protein
VWARASIGALRTALTVAVRARAAGIPPPTGPFGDDLAGLLRGAATRRLTRVAAGQVAARIVTAAAAVTSPASWTPVSRSPRNLRASSTVAPG